MTRASLMRALFVPLLALSSTACLRGHVNSGPVVPDRPGYTDTPTVLSRGSVQVEVGYTDDRSSGASYRTFGESLLRVGLVGPVELRLFGNSLAERTAAGASRERGIEDAKLGVKVRLIEKPDSVHGITPNLALLVASTVPLGARGFGAGVAQPEAKLAASWTTPSPFSIYTNAGVGSVYDGATWKTHGWGSVALWYAVNPRVSLFTEGLSSHPTSDLFAPSAYVDGGITVLITEQFQADFRIGRGVASNVRGERFFGFGIARRW